MLSPSLIHRSEVLVGIATPIVPFTAAADEPDAPVAGVPVSRPHADIVSARAAAAAMARILRIALPTFSASGGWADPASPEREVPGSGSSWCLDANAKAEGSRVPGERVGEVTLVGVAGDERQLDPGDLCEILEVGGGELGAQHGVVRTARGEPALGGGREVRHRAPYGAGHRELRHRVGHTNDLDLVRDEAQPIAQVAQPERHAGTGSGIEHESYGVGTVADSEGVDLHTWLRCRDRRADLEHVCAEDQLVARLKVVRVVLHERGTAGQTLRHRLERVADHCGLPVALAAEADTGGHQPLYSHAGELLKAAEVFEVGRERPVAALDHLSLIHISEPTRRTPISYAVFCLKT